MKLLSRDAEKTVFQMGKREKRQFLQVLGLYPRIPTAHYTISRDRSLPGFEESQRLLDEAIAELRAENQRRLKEFLAEPGRFSEGAGLIALAIPAASLEWLLQILNDVRVGSWVAVGSPMGSILGVLSAKTAPDIWAMEVAGYFEACLLEAITGENPHG